MPGPLEDSVAEVAQRLLIALGLAAAPDSTPWPAFYDRWPDLPDELVSAHVTTGKKHGRSMKDGEVAELEAVLLRVRGRTSSRALAKARAIAVGLDDRAATQQRLVTLPNANVYKVWAVHRDSGPIDAGDEPGTKRALATLNLTLSLRQVG